MSIVSFNFAFLRSFILEKVVLGQLAENLADFNRHTAKIPDSQSKIIFLAHLF